MNKKENKNETKNSNTNFDNISVEKKVIEQSIDSQIDFDAIDNANAYYSERYGWTLRKN
tara:strand:- start:1176 stop:1352 length:177 start_codon:yes stop_codon:yes gene_type:complete